jgi:hypothetical protein
MKIQSHPQNISITVLDRIQLDAREAAFLRKMAQHCIETNMRGFMACETLIAVLDRMQVPMYDGGPTYGLFE